jgi:hypothetical protein
VALAGALAVAAGAPEPPSTANQLLRTPASQMDVGIGRLWDALLPVFLDLPAARTVAWNDRTSRIVVRVAMDGAGGEAAWQPARRAAAAVRQRLGVDPDRRRVIPGEEERLRELFALSAAPAPAAEDLAGLIRLVVAVRTGPNLSPTFYSADLLGGDVQLDINPD